MITDEELPEVLYHYCSTEAFYSIIKNKCLWMSSLTMSNDTMEGRWAIDIAKDVAKRSFAPAAYDLVEENLQSLGDSYTCVGLCLSSERDLLSQWRGYAANGGGVCIGISTEALIDMVGYKERMCEFISLFPVLYERHEQEAEVEKAYAKLRAKIEDEDLYLPIEPIDGGLSDAAARRDYALTELGNAFFDFTPNLYMLKSPAFREEAEWRVTRDIYGHRYRGLEFRASGNKIVPYDVLDFTDIETPFIREVILGPKHETPVETVRGFLNQHDMYRFHICRSSASYK